MQCAGWRLCNDITDDGGEMSEYWSDVALFTAGAICVCAFATCEVQKQRSQDAKEIELKKIECLEKK